MEDPVTIPPAIKLQLWWRAAVLLSEGASSEPLGGYLSIDGCSSTSSAPPAWKETVMDGPRTTPTTGLKPMLRDTVTLCLPQRSSRSVLLVVAASNPRSLYWRRRSRINTQSFLQQSLRTPPNYCCLQHDISTCVFTMGTPQPPPAFSFILSTTATPTTRFSHKAIVITRFDNVLCLTTFLLISRGIVPLFRHCTLPPGSSLA